jgi:hypothetical protein
MTRRNLITAKRKPPERDPIVRRAIIRIRKLDKLIALSGRRFLDAVVRQGKELERLKDYVGVGNWLRVARKHLPFSIDTGENRINVSRLLSQRRFRNLRNQPFEVLCAIGRRTVPDEARVAFAKRAATGKRMTIADVRHEVRRIGYRGTSTSVQLKSITAEDVLAASTQPKPITAEDLEPDRYRYLIELLVDVVGKLPPVEEARAVVESASGAGRRDSFTLAVAMLDEFIGALHRALNERSTSPLVLSGRPPAHRNPARRTSYRQIRFAPRILPAP